MYYAKKESSVKDFLLLYQDTPSLDPFLTASSSHGQPIAKCNVEFVWAAMQVYQMHFYSVIFSAASS